MKTTEEIISEVKAGLTGNFEQDVAYLNSQLIKYRNSENAQEIIMEIAKILNDIIPQDKIDEAKEQIFVNDKRFDAIFHEANELVAKNKDIQGAYEMMKPVAEKIDKYFEIDDDIYAEEQYFSFRVPLEEILYNSLWTFKPTKNVKKAPYDFSTILTFYGFLLVELKKYDEAITTLKKAIHYNPFNANAFFELCEVFKVTKDVDRIPELTRYTLKICLDRPSIARCYCNMGFYCIEKEDYQSAMCFYQQSLGFQPNESIKGEIAYIAHKSNLRMKPMNSKEVEETFERYNIDYGPNQDVVKILDGIGKYTLEKGDKEQARFYLRVLYNLTRNEQVRLLLNQAMQKEEQPSESK